MTRIAVTGASGFVARHLVPLLRREGHEVKGLSRSAPDPTGPVSTLPGFAFVQGDVCLPGAVQAAIDGCEQIFHLAASFSPDDDVAEINERGTQSVIAAAKDAGIQRLIYVSCLGADAGSDSPFYASKWKAEALVRGSGVPHVILRPSLIVGRGDGVVRPLADLMRTFPVVPIPGRGEARLQPIDVGDLCRCLLAALSDDTLLNETVSVGGPMFVTLRQLIDLIAGEVKVARPKLLVPYRLLPAVGPYFPASVRQLYSPPRVAQFRQGVVASPGIVPRMFGFEPSNILPGLASYLA